MSNSAKPRKRAVRLTPEALEMLQSTLAKRWQESENGDKPTRAAKAKLLDASVATAEKIYSGQGVDRSTLAAAFKSLGLVWEDSYCTSVHEEPEVAPSPEFAPEQDPSQEISVETPPIDVQQSSPARRGWRRGYAPAGISVGVAVAAVSLAILAPRVLAPPSSWMSEYNLVLSDGTTRFHKADYVGARAAADRAMSLARDHDSAAYLSSAFRLAGDIEAAEGRLTVARNYYRSALEIRTVFGQAQARPAIYEALGNVEIRLGELQTAEKSLTESLSGYRSAKDPVGVAMASRSLGTLAVRKNNLEAAERWFQASLDSVSGFGKPDIVADVDGQRARVALKRGRAREARATFQRCLDYWTAQGHSRWIAVCQLRLGEAEAALGRRDEAIALMRRSKAGFQKVGDRVGVSEASSLLNRLEERLTSNLSRLDQREHPRFKHANLR